MPASIVFKQGSSTSPAGVARLVEKDVPVLCTSATPASIYLWKLVDVPIRSGVSRDLSSTTDSFTFTPDVPGTYLVSLKVNNSNAAADTAISFCAVRTSGEGRMGWRYRAAGEAEEDSITTHDFDGVDLGFANSKNPRGWATEDDLEREQVENAVYRVTQATSLAADPGYPSLVAVNPATGRIHSSLFMPYEHVQTIASEVWQIQHNLGYHPAIVLEDETGEEIRATVRHLSNQVSRAEFSAPQAGKATCR